MPVSAEGRKAPKGPLAPKGLKVPRQPGAKHQAVPAEGRQVPRSGTSPEGASGVCFAAEGGKGPKGL